MTIGSEYTLIWKKITNSACFWVIPQHFHNIFLIYIISFFLPVRVKSYHQLLVHSYIFWKYREKEDKNVPLKIKQKQEGKPLKCSSSDFFILYLFFSFKFLYRFLVLIKKNASKAIIFRNIRKKPHKDKGI